MLMVDTPPGNGRIPMGINNLKQEMDMAKTLLKGDGLNYASMDHTTPEELQAFRDFFIKSKGYSIPAHEFLLEHRPDVLKRYRYWSHIITSDEESARPLAHVVAMLHYYAIVGYGDGILYEIRLSQFSGATKDEIIDTLAVAALHGHPRGTRYVAESSSEYMRTYQDPPPKPHWPDSWSFDPHAFDSGVDYSTPEASKDDIAKILDWYQTKLGEVPRYVRMMADYRPKLLKAYRDRYEHAIRAALPKELMPFLHLNFCTIAGYRDGIREAVLLGRSFGMTRAQLTDAIFWGIYGAPEAFSIADEAAGDILKKMD
jgi:hypothetical protein